LNLKEFLIGLVLGLVVFIILVFFIEIIVILNARKKVLKCKAFELGEN